MPANPDFRDLFAAFNAARVRYLLVGGYALAFHGRPRFTKDLDIWLAPDAENAASDPSVLRYSTPHRFKGLEADVVLLCDVDGNPTSCAPGISTLPRREQKNRLYVFQTER